MTPYHHANPHAGTIAVVATNITAVPTVCTPTNHAIFALLSCKKCISSTINGANASLWPAAKLSTSLPAMWLLSVVAFAHHILATRRRTSDARKTGRRPKATDRGMLKRLPMAMKSAG